eukprot:TRINITY_DN1831_c1_g1_i3.p1 TRINITY_DN1831_c1_g1~~TRINITY_DN1831_c1_g1_i3.p1  ORF type:complete len:519 (+),score=154.78 TRINITY_DN1831_c1_g1_i3:453-2009(+)
MFSALSRLVDNLPAAVKKQVFLEEGSDVATTIYDAGFPLGFKGDPVLYPGTDEGVNYIYNHVTIRILLNSDESEGDQTRIVGFEVYPASVNHKWEDDNKEGSPQTCSAIGTAPFQAVKEGDEVVWTYDVEWETSDLRWSSRWDPYLMSGDDQIHWFSIINSLMIVLFLTGMVAMILLRTLSADFVRYNQQMEDPEEDPEETGWKLVHTDVFRPPDFPMMLSVFFGTGVQVYFMTLFTMVFALLGFLSPATRGGLSTALLLLFVLMGLMAGYASSRNYKMLKQEAWKTNFVLTAILLPGICTFIFLIIDFALWSLGSSAAVPFGTILALFSMWLFISVPLVFGGSYIGYSKEEIKQPVRTMNIPRGIPDQPWYMNTIVVVLAGGILPFGAIFIELFFIMSSIWLDQVYYLFGFLFVVFAILTITSAEISISLCYFQLCSEDYHWWWRSFLTPGASGLYVFFYCISYFISNVHGIGIASGILFFGYTLIICILMFVMTGAIGYASTLLFVRKIYGSIKVD